MQGARGQDAVGSYRVRYEDEVQIHLVPVLLGAGRRLFDGPSPRVEMQVVRVIDTPEATHVRYRIRRP
ncbi:hypothetical protein ACIA5D_39320 [Actinoplanes sp. NPDC051513]|uniref:hypothetical protein n=1 Tax=Actinoplanes sp. NPDC051513 TaxID=3363908 RepID=UPI0037B6A25C